MYVCVRVYVYIYMCVFMYTHRFAQTELNSLQTQKANLPLHSCIPMSFHVHCSVTRMENSLHVAYSLEVNHCLTGRDKTMMILSGRLEESLDISSELRGREELPVASLLPSSKMKCYLFAMDTICLWAEKKLFVTVYRCFIASHSYPVRE